MEKLAQVNIGENFGSSLGTSLTIGDIVSRLISLSFIVAGIILLFLLVGAGIAIIGGAGKENPEQVAKGKQAATAALIGFVVVFAAYWVIKLIEVFTDLPFITAPKL